MLNRKKVVMLVLSIFSGQACAASPITLFIPEAQAREIEQKSYTVPDLKGAASPITTKKNASHQEVLQKTQYPQHQHVATAKKSMIAARDRAPLALSEKYQDAEPIVGQGDNGKVTYIFGQTQPTIICSPLRVCMIELEANEVIQDQYAGDHVRWDISPSASVPTPFIAIKPKEANVSTNYVVITNKRIYSFILQSSKNRYMSMINFSYPENAQQKWAAYYAAQNNKDAADSKNKTPKYVLQTQSLDFNYQISGNAKFKPTRVYTDGAKTYIELPESVKNSELPIFTSETESGKSKVLNARYIGNKYIIDQKITKGVLQAGSGKHAEKINIVFSGKTATSATSTNNRSDDYHGM